MKKVHLACCADAREMTLRALRGIDGEFFRGKSVLLKPDATCACNAQSGKVTNPQVVGAVIDWLRENGATELAIGESPALGVRAADAFAASGLAELAGDKKVRLLDFDGGANISLPVPDGQRPFLVVTAALNDYDCLVSLPVWRPTPFGLSLMNLRGLMWRAQKLAFYGRYAPGISPEQAGLKQAFSDLRSCVRPDLTVIDGSFSARYKGDGLVLAATDSSAANEVAACFVAHDCTACGEIVCNPPEALGWADDFSCQVEEPATRPEITLANMQGCTSCLLAVYNFLDRYYPQLDPQKALDFFIGFGKGQGPEGCFYVGSCGGQLSRSGNGVRVAGCPPQPRQIAQALGLELPEDELSSR